MSGVPFTSIDHERSRIVREVLDSFDGPPIPYPAKSIQTMEAIELSGNEVRAEFRTGEHVVRRRFTAAFDTAPALALLDEPSAPLQPFADVEPTLQAAAAERLRAIQTASERRAFTRSRPVPVPSPWPYIAVAGLMIAGFVVLWLAVRR
jgi:hypothetical protein